MTPQDLQQQMRDDWDRRAREDALYYVAFGRRQQSEEEFFGTAAAAQVLYAIRIELVRFPPFTDPKNLTALEIGCGPGRLLVPLSRFFGHVIGVDVAPEMVERARLNLAGISNARAEVCSGADLSAFDDESFDFCYSYAVFQHIPSREAVWSYLREAWRVLKTGGILKCQFNGLRPGDSQALDTWSGVRFSTEEIRAFCHDQDFQLLMLEGAETPNMWMTARKRSRGWSRSVRPASGARLFQVSSTWCTDMLVPAAGRFASASLWLENLSEDADINNLEVEIAGRRQAPCFVGRANWANPTQVNAFLLKETPTGLISARLFMLGEPISGFAHLRTIPPAPRVPRLLRVADGINRLSGTHIETRSIKVDVEEVGPSPTLDADLDGLPLEKLDLYCEDPLPERYVLCLRVPPETAKGPHLLTVRRDGRPFAPVQIEIAD